MKDIEKLFEEKLKHHQVSPAPQSWDRLQQQMQGKYKKRAIPMFAWQAAAVVVLLAGASLIRHFYVQQTQSSGNVAQQQVHLPKEAEQDTGSTRVYSHDSPQKPTPPVAQWQPEEVTKAKHKKLEQVVRAQQSFSQQQASRAPSEVRPEAVALPGEVPQVASQQVHRFTATADEASARMAEPSFVAITERHMPITITYKADPMEEKGQDRKVFAFLDNLKSSNISFSELRQAKDDLVAKAFSFKN